MGQTIISAGLVVIVTIAVINANRLIINSETTKLEGQARLQAADIAMEVLTEARLRKFDEYADTVYYQGTGEFTSYSSLGPESGESVSLPDVYPYQSRQRYDDMDDFNNYRRTVNTISIVGYVVTCKVYYSSQTYPDTPKTSKTYVKTMEVNVSHPLYLVTPIRLSMTRTY